MCPNGPEAMLADAAFAASQGEVYFGDRDEPLYLLAEAQLLAGDVEQALATLAEASSTSARLGHGTVIAIAETELALVAMDRGKWAEAAGRLDKALSVIAERRLQEYLASSLAYAGAARLALHHGDLEQARRQLAQAMRARPSAAIEALEAAGAPVSFPAVAKAAGVSTWLAYAEGIREHVEAARRRQTEHDGTIGSRPPVPDDQRATPASLRTELAVAREEIKGLRAERDKFRKRLRLHLGAEIEGPDRAQLITRVADLETVNRQLVAERDARAGERDTARQRVVELEDELIAGRESLRRVIRAENRGR
jgi:tetratricopeptide (TPR) repeat protein